MKKANAGVTAHAQGLFWGVDPTLVGTDCAAASPSRPICELGVYPVAPKRCSNKEIHFLPNLGAVGCSLLLGGALNVSARAVGCESSSCGAMLSSGLPPVLLFLTGLELSCSLSDEEKKIILDGHNKYRSQVSPPAMDMLKMVSGFYCGGILHIRGCLCSASLNFKRDCGFL